MVCKSTRRNGWILSEKKKKAFRCKRLIKLSVLRTSRISINVSAVSTKWMRLRAHFHRSYFGASAKSQLAIVVPPPPTTAAWKIRNQLHSFILPSAIYYIRYTLCVCLVSVCRMCKTDASFNKFSISCSNFCCALVRFHISMSCCYCDDIVSTSTSNTRLLPYIYECTVHVHDTQIMFVVWVIYAIESVEHFIVYALTQSVAVRTLKTWVINDKHNLRRYRYTSHC